MFEKKWIKHVIALSAFLLVSVIYCKPVLEGKLLQGNDNYSSLAMVKDVNDVADKTGEFIPWSNSMFSGMPEPVNVKKRNFLKKWPYTLRQAPQSMSYDVFLGLMIGAYILCCALGLNLLIAIVCAMAYSFMAYNVMSLGGGHLMKQVALFFLPAVLGGIIYLFNKKHLKGAMILLPALTLFVGINHVQITYYGILISLFLIANLAIIDLKNKEFNHLFKIAGIGLGCIIISVMANFTIFNTMDYAEQTTRGGKSELSGQDDEDALDIDYAQSWSLGRLETFTFIIPDFTGGSSSNSFVSDKQSATLKALRNFSKKGDPNQFIQSTTGYWGTQPFVAGGYYMGVTICFLFLMFVIASRSNKRWWLLSSFVVLVMMSWGKNFAFLNDFLFYNLPLYDKFRVPSMTLMVVQILLFAGAGLGLQLIFDRKVDIKQFYATVVTLGGLLILFALFGNSFFSFIPESQQALPDWLQDALAKDRAQLLSKDALRSLVFVLLLAAICWTYLTKKLSVKIFLPIVVVLILVDMIGVSYRHISWEDFKSKRSSLAIFNPSPANVAIMQDPDPHFRVINTTVNPFTDYITSYHHNNIGGYHGAKLRRYQELIENHLGRNNRKVLNMLNTKYFIVRGNDQQPGAARNPDALGNAWLIDSLVVVPTGQDEMDALNNFNPGSQAIIQEKNLVDSQPLIYDRSGQIQLTEYYPHRMKYTYNSQSPSFAVFSEVFYKQSNGDGWKAHINGEELEIQKVNYLLRGVQLPAGAHTINMIYDSKVYLRRCSVDYYFNFVVLLLSLGLIYLFVKKEYVRKPVKAK